MEQEDKKQDVLAIWQTCVEMANEVSQRRDTSCGYFISTISNGSILPSSG